MADPMAANSPLDLVKVFSSLQSVLAQNQGDLNQVDNHNHNHGDNMVETFEVITQAVREKQGSASSDQLAHASQLLRQKTASGSGQLYSQGLERAAANYRGKPVTADNAMQLLAALMGSQTSPAQASGASQDPLGGLTGDLLAGLMGGDQAQAQAPAAGQDPFGGLAGSLLSGLMGGDAATQAKPQDGFDAGDLINAGKIFMQAKQQGASSSQALIKALLAASPMSQAAHREQSGTLIANTFLQLIGAMAKK